MVDGDEEEVDAAGDKGPRGDDSGRKPPPLNNDNELGCEVVGVRGEEGEELRVGEVLLPVFGGVPREGPPLMKPEERGPLISTCFQRRTSAVAPPGLEVFGEDKGDEEEIDAPVLREVVIIGFCHVDDDIETA